MSFKDRKDGVYIKPSDAIHAIMPHLMKNRTEAEVYMPFNIDVTELVNMLENKNKKNDKYKITYFHAFTTAIAKTIYNRPLLNYFIAGRRYYKRNEISLSFVAKNKFEDNAEERLIIAKIKDDMNLDSISKFIYDEVSKTRKNGTNNMDKTLNFVTKFPRCITSFIMWSFRRLDYHGLVPKSISNTDPNYTTVLLSNLGSIKANSCYHHLNNYGTNSILITIGEIKKEIINNKERYIANFGFTVDERIADGFYFAKSIKLFEYILTNPKLLDEKVSKDVNYES